MTTNLETGHRSSGTQDEARQRNSFKRLGFFVRKNAGDEDLV